MARKPQKQKCVTLLVQAIAADPEREIPSYVRLLLHTMAHVANSRTGKSFVGQASLAARMTSTERQVRRGIDWINEEKAFPVKIARRARFRETGRGRTSDEWQLVLPDMQSARSPVSAAPTGQYVRTNRTYCPDQPDSLSGDLTEISDGVIRRSNSASASEAVPPLVLEAQSADPSPTKRAAKRVQKAKPADPEHGAKHSKVVAHYFDGFERKRGSKPVGFDGADGRAVSKLLQKCKGDADEACKVITGAFASWKGDTVTIRQIASNPSEFVGAQARKLNGRSPVQPVYGVEIDAEEYG